MDDYRIGIVSEPILGVSYRIISATVVSANITCITAGSSTVDGSHYTWWSKGVQAPRHPPAAGARVRSVLWSMIRESVGRGGEAEGDCNLIPASFDTKTVQYWSWMWDTLHTAFDRSSGTLCTVGGGGCGTCIAWQRPVSRTTVMTDAAS